MKTSPNFWFVIGIVVLALLVYSFVILRSHDRFDEDYQRSHTAP